MNKIFLIPLLTFSFNLFANDGLTIPNSFKVDKQGQVFRGREPKKLISELPQIGITDVIIFKNDVKGEVQEEIDGLRDLRISAHHIPFLWKDYPSVEVACTQVVEAINTIYKIKKSGGKVFFHCTAGEDRTGALAGLYRMLEEHLPASTVFKTEMCARGYSDGNPKKPAMVTAAIQKELTPLFVALSQKIEKGEWKLGQLNKSSCRGIIVSATNLRCKK